MPKRFHLASDLSGWTAEVAGERVALTPEVQGSAGSRAQGSGAAPLAVVRSGDRLSVRGLDADVTGAAEMDGDVVWVTVGGEVFAFTVTHGSMRAGGGRDHDALTPPMAATVIRIAVKPGDRVHDGDVLVALEAMKMELPIRAPRDAVVRAVNCRQGELVQPGQVLIEIDPE